MKEVKINYKRNNDLFTLKVITEKEISKEQLNSIKKLFDKKLYENIYEDMITHTFKELSNKNITIYNVIYKKYMLNMCQAKHILTFTL